MAIVTCRTEGCAKHGEPVEMLLTWVDDDGQERPVDAVMCGACEQPITDIADEQ